MLLQVYFVFSVKVFASVPNLTFKFPSSSFLPGRPRANIDPRETPGQPGQLHQPLLIQTGTNINITGLKSIIYRDPNKG